MAALVPDVVAVVPPPSLLGPASRPTAAHAAAVLADGCEVELRVPLDREHEPQPIGSGAVIALLHVGHNALGDSGRGEAAGKAGLGGERLHHGGGGPGVGAKERHGCLQGAPHRRDGDERGWRVEEAGGTEHPSGGLGLFDSDRVELGIAVHEGGRLIPVVVMPHPVTQTHHPHHCTGRQRRLRARQLRRRPLPLEGCVVQRGPIPAGALEVERVLLVPVRHRARARPDDDPSQPSCSRRRVTGLIERPDPALGVRLRGGHQPHRARALGLGTKTEPQVQRVDRVLLDPAAGQREAPTAALLAARGV
mmetsp:Transcript_15459/g.50469  ORF Transcript_15459/g.50469 Transcript_15459/m.50469 type:complete len:307 (+) Transcript_15459:371-1291(+)